MILAPTGHNAGGKRENRLRQRASDTVSLLECRSNTVLVEVTVSQSNEFVTVKPSWQ